MDIFNKIYIYINIYTCTYIFKDRYISIQVSVGIYAVFLAGTISAG